MNVTITIKKSKVGEPELEVFHTRVEDGAGVWKETFGSRHDLDLFLKGFRSGCVMSGNHEEPKILEQR